jgi:lipid II:glycine glycyltransferase (peptidoglycan interpeptide bridge formation enzyme)
MENGGTAFSKHIVQSPEWGEFKTVYGTPAVHVGDIQYTKHHIPFTKNFFGYCPKVDPTKIEFAELRKSLEENECASINFDVPNVLKNTPEESVALDIFSKNNCVLSPRDQFAKSNVLMDLTATEEELLGAAHYKHRYNIKYAEKNGVTVKVAQTQRDFDTFWELFETTSKRQKYYIRPKNYYQKIWDMFGPKGMCYILTSEYKDTPLASWMLFKYEDVLYYPYGGSSEQYKNMHGSTYLGWRVIMFGKESGCKTFDMWGAGKDITDQSDPWWGFTNFKLKYGGKYVTYIDSYDYVVDQTIYKMFNVANDLRWKLLRFIK